MYYIFILFQLYFSTFGQAIAAMAPNEETAATLTTLLFTFVILFNGVLQPLSQLVGFWHFMYHLSPFTYLISGMMSNVAHNLKITCAPQELNIFSPPPDFDGTCQDYAGPFVQQAIGYIVNPEATSDCEYCRFSVGDDYLMTVNMSWSHRWRNAGFLWAYIVFNIAAVFFFFYLTRVATWKLSIPSFLRRQKKAKVAHEGEDRIKYGETARGAAIEPVPAEIGAGPAIGGLGESAVTGGDTSNRPL